MKLLVAVAVYHQKILFAQLAIVLFNFKFLVAKFVIVLFYFKNVGGICVALS